MNIPKSIFKIIFAILAILLGLVVGYLVMIVHNQIQNKIFESVKYQNINNDNETNIKDVDELLIYYPEPTQIDNNLEDKTIKVTFIGDMMFDRFIRSWAIQNSYDDLFKYVRDKFWESDLVVGNLEGPITDYDTIYTHGSIPNNFTFTFDPIIARILKEANVGVVSLDNNHIFDYGREGARQTLEYLDSVGILYFGHPDKREPLYVDVEGIRLAFLSYNQFILPDYPGLIDDIKEARENSDFVVVFPHWGNEYELIPTENQIRLGRSFIDAGVDLVIGAHPHVIQKKEFYNGGYIYYSLGNFIFDQYFSDDVKCGAVVTFKLDKNSVISVKEEFVSLSSNRIVEFSDCLDEIKEL